MHYKPVVLTILDGFGVAPDSDGNAVTRAKMPHWQEYLKNYPVMNLFASGAEVGLVFGQMGNSEVGHLNIGAGRIYYQTCPRINKAIGDGSFFENKVFLDAVEHARAQKSKLHLIGLVGSGNVHASSEHLYALLELCRRQKFDKEVYVHCFLDGRDALYNSGRTFVSELQKKIQELKVGKIASLCGRFYAMDRDNNWDRTEKSYLALCSGKGERANSDPLAAIDESYAQKNYDEEFLSTVITERGKPVATIGARDSVIFFNFRPDRARQLTKALVLPGFNKFERPYLKDLFFVTMSEYEKDLPVVVAFPPVVVHNTLAETVSKAGLKQIHIAETQKYAHITFFLNGTIEEPFPGEQRALVPSARVADFATVPEMSAYEITKEAVKAIDSGQYGLVAINFANPDIVGHTGDIKATAKACAVTDKCLGDIVDHTLAVGGAVVVTADHGNAEEVKNLQTGEIDKEHSTNPVPLLIIARDFLGQAGPGGDPPEGDLSLMPPVGVLADVAPTVLKLMGLDQPTDMTGSALI